MSDFTQNLGNGIKKALGVDRADSVLNTIGDAASKVKDSIMGSKPSSGGGADPDAVKAANQTFVDKAKASPVKSSPVASPKAPVHKKMMPSYKSGTDYVPKTGPAQLHKGEAVLPKDEADKHRQGKAMNFKDAVKGELSGKSESHPKEIHEMHIKKVKGKNAHVITHHHTHPAEHPSETHTTEGTDGLMGHVMDHMTEPNPGEADADAGQSGIPGAAGAGPAGPSPAAMPPQGGM